ncbi:MAG: FadR/GntR family transcriptional regulator [Myxococcota bacterium]
MSFKPVKRQLAVDEVAAQLRREVLSGSIRPGELFPPERQLAETLGVSRLTLRAALSRLYGQGLVTIRQGDGVRAADFRRRSTLDVLVDLFDVFATDVEAGTKLLRDLLELRRVLAAEMVALSCARKTKETLKRLAERVDALEALASKNVTRREIAAAEIEISHALVEASGNAAFGLILNTLERFNEVHPEVVEGIQVDPMFLVASYRQLVASIEAGDAQAARQMVVEGMAAIDETVVQQFIDSKRKPQPSKPTPTE